MNSGSDATVANRLKDVLSISADLQQRIRSFLVDFDLEFFIATKQTCQQLFEDARETDI